jgi:prevent-host-death family protein
MVIVNLLDAKSNLSRLVEAVESGAEAEIVIARDGRPSAKLVPRNYGDSALNFIGPGSLPKYQ